MEEVWFVVYWYMMDVTLAGPFGYDRNAAVEFCKSLVERGHDPEDVRLVKLPLERP